MKRLQGHHFHWPTRGWAQWLMWIILAVVLVIFVNSLVLRSYRVSGISMEPTLRSGELVFANKLGRTFSNLTGRPYIPKRGELVVFKNPFYDQGNPDAFIVKRVIGLPGDRVEVRDGRITIFPTAAPTPYGFNPDKNIAGPQQPTSGNVNRIVPEGEIFVVGDNRQSNNSLDSRNGMSTVSVNQLEGNVVVRFWPFHKLRLF